MYDWWPRAWPPPSGPCGAGSRGRGGGEGDAREGAGRRGEAGAAQAPHPVRERQPKAGGAEPSIRAATAMPVAAGESTQLPGPSPGRAQCRAWRAMHRSATDGSRKAGIRIVRIYIVKASSLDTSLISTEKTQLRRGGSGRSTDACVAVVGVPVPSRAGDGFCRSAARCVIRQLGQRLSGSAAEPRRADIRLELVRGAVSLGCAGAATTYQRVWFSAMRALLAAGPGAAGVLLRRELDERSSRAGAARR